MKQAVVNFAVYEDGVDYLGIAKVKLPDVKHLTTNLSGAGVAGNIEVVHKGIIEAMSMTIEFLMQTDETIKLSEPRRHTIDLRAANQYEDAVKGNIGVEQAKHVLVVIPKNETSGTLAPGSTMDGSLEYTVRSWTTYLAGKKVRHIDPVNFVFEVNGINYLADTKKALGK